MPEKLPPILFSPPDISEAEIDAVGEALRSGWITTGPRTKELEKRLCAFTRADGFVCLNSATAALECALRLLGIGPGDEVITSAYTYTASASVIDHVGAKIVLVDTAPGSFEMNYMALTDHITERTKAIIPVDLGGRMCDYRQLTSMLELKRALYRPENEIQRLFDRIPIIADGAHALGATWQGDTCGSVADFTAFSFHAVKNLTTAEGGGLAWRLPRDARAMISADDIYQRLMLISLHGQNKDAMTKARAGSWEYDIEFLGWKYNMTDVAAALGLKQLERYPQLLMRRREIIERYEDKLKPLGVRMLSHFASGGESSGHLMLVRIDNVTEAFRNRVIELMGQCQIATNVHYKPLPMLSAYKALGFDIADFPNAYQQYCNEISLPLHTLLSDADVDRVVESFAEALDQTQAEGLAEASPETQSEARLRSYIEYMDKIGGWSGAAAPRAFAVGDEEQPVSQEEIERERRQS